MKPLVSVSCVTVAMAATIGGYVDSTLNYTITTTMTALLETPYCCTSKPQANISCVIVAVWATTGSSVDSPLKYNSHDSLGDH